jgi:DNA-binding transcriptional MerR regulator
MLKVGQLAALTGVSVRTLHHYDEIDLVKPSARSDAGYRLYTDRDLERLQQVLFYRALGFALEHVARIVSDPKFDRTKALHEHRARLVEDAKKTKAMLDLVDKTLASIEKGQTMEPKDMFTGFEEEAKARWGKTDAYAESARRTKTYGKDDWARISKDAEEISRALAEVMRAGIAPSDARAMDLAERHREHIDRWFYACTSEIHVGLGEMYVADERFAANYEKIEKGLAAFFRDAIAANASR